MKKINIFILVLAIFLSPFKIVQAESSCTYSEQVELNDLSAYVKTTYEATDVYYGKSINIDGDGEEVDVYTRGLKISILNITDKIYIKLINKNTKEEKTYYYSDSTDGIITFDTGDVEDITDYDVEVYANTYSCAGELYRKFSFSTPRYNSYSRFAVCDENPNFYYCQEFIQSPDIDINQFYTDLANYQKEEEQKEEKNTLWGRIKNFYNEHALAINITAGVVLVSGVTTTVILVKKRRSRVYNEKK